MSRILCSSQYRYCRKQFFVSSYFIHTIIPLQCHIPFADIPKSIQKSINKREVYLKSLGVQFEKYELKSTENSFDFYSNELIVGKLYQYPHISHHNLSLILHIFAKTRLNRNSWSFDNRIQEEFGTKITTAIDYHPFSNTFHSNKNPTSAKKHSKKQTSKTLSAWNIQTNGLELEGIWPIIDAFDSSLPYLTRHQSLQSTRKRSLKANIENETQELLIFRDNTFDISNVNKLHSVVKKYQPNCILIECGRHPFIDTYVENRFSYRYLKLLPIRLLSMLTPTQFLRTEIMGKFLYNCSKRLYEREMASYSTQSAIDCCSKYNIPLVCSDMNDKYFDTLRIFTEYLDYYNKATLIYYGFIDEKYFMSSVHKRLTLNLNYLLGNRLNPHLTTLNSYRNDILASVINELDVNEYRKILLVASISRLKDLFDKLEGRTVAHEWIETLDEQFISIKNISRFIGNDGFGVSNTKFELSEEELLRCCQYLGFAGTAFLLMPEFEMKSDMIPIVKLQEEQSIGELVEKVRLEGEVLAKAFGSR